MATYELPPPVPLSPGIGKYSPGSTTVASPIYVTGSGTSSPATSTKRSMPTTLPEPSEKTLDYEWAKLDSKMHEEALRMAVKSLTQGSRNPSASSVIVQARQYYIFLKERGVRGSI